MADEQNLDGKTPVIATPFDAHEQATRGEHVPTTATSPDPDPESIQQYPKAVDHVEGSEKGHKEPVIVKSPEEEKAYLDAKAEEKASPAAAKTA